MSVKPAVIPPESERQFQVAVLELAKVLHWRSYHTFDSRRSTAGFPDLVLVKPPRVIFAELKRAGARLRPEQWAWLSDLDDCPGVEVYQWRPGDMPRIAETLGGH